MATFGGTLQAGYSVTGGDVSANEAIFVRLDAGAESASISLDREVYDGGMGHPDGALHRALRRGRAGHRPPGARLDSM